MKIINRKDVEKKLVKIENAFGVDVQLAIGAEDGTPAYSMRIFTVNPDGHTPYHSHNFEHLNYVISGHGVIRTEDGPFWIEAGDCILVPANVKHCYENVPNGSAEDLVFICLVPKTYECGCPDVDNKID